MTVIYSSAANDVDVHTLQYVKGIVHVRTLLMNFATTRSTVSHCSWNDGNLALRMSIFPIASLPLLLVAELQS